jgi:L,D-transpeptidase ErfK/SrfK
MLSNFRIFKLSALTLASVVATGLSAHATPQASVKAPEAKPFIGQMQKMNAAYEDTLVHIGREYGVGFVEMRAANPTVDPWLPGSGTEIIIPTMNILPDAPRQGVVINLAEMRLYYFKTPNTEPVTFPIGIGRDGLKTPLGVTTVVRKKEKPTWIPTERMRKEDPTLPAIVPPGPDNPMGSHSLYLGFPTIAIHGTNKPYGIGRRVSSGCIRMFPEDISQVYDMVPVGTRVTVVDQPIKAAWIGDRLFLEVHPTQEQAAVMEQEGTVPDYQLSERDLSMIMRVAGKEVKTLDWQKIRKIVKERKGYPIAIAVKSKSDSELATKSE